MAIVSKCGHELSIVLHLNKPAHVHQGTIMPLQIRSNLATSYADVYTPEALAALEALAPLDAERKALMSARIERRARRARNQERIGFLEPGAMIGRTKVKVQDARDG